MRDSEFGIRSLVLTLVLFCVVAFAISGCAGTDSVGSEKNVINADQFKVLQKARSEFGPFINDMSQALNPSYPLGMRLEKVRGVIDKYKAKFPDPVSLSYLAAHPDLAKEYENTETGALMYLMPYTDGAAGLVADDYLGAVEALYGLEDFETFVSDHTTDEGTRSNPGNPMPVFENGQSKVFGNRGFGRSVSIAASVNPSSGLIAYRLVGNEVTDASLAQIQSQFINVAVDLLREGDNGLLDWTRL
jgi:hypothetical protein